MSDDDQAQARDGITTGIVARSLFLGAHSDNPGKGAVYNGRQTSDSSRLSFWDLINVMHGRGYLLAASLALGWTPALATADEAAIERGRTLAGTCLGCHGVPSYTNVYPTYHVPKLGGQHAEYIVAALKAYQSGERSHATMRAHSVRLSEEQIRDIATYFSSLE